MTNLKPYNTFQVSVFAKDFLEVSNLSDLSHLGDLEKVFVLGHGANTLFTKDFDGLVIKNNLKGKKVLKEDKNEVLVEVASGEDWNEFDMWTVDNGWSGVENLAYIPGTVGGAVVGNIGAYGQTFENVFVSAKSGKEIFYKNQCHFGYRESAFKHELRKYFIENVTLKFTKNPDAKKIAEETTALRKAKLPDWTKIGTAGSVFKNPFVTPEKLADLLKEDPNLTHFSNKVSAGYLLEKLGWKGKQIGRVSTYPKHALIVINLGGATGKEIYDYIQLMKTDVKKHYKIELEEEINVV